MPTKSINHSLALIVLVIISFCVSCKARTEDAALKNNGKVVEDISRIPVVQVFRDYGDGYGAGCSGTIFTKPPKILTAGHCVVSPSTFKKPVRVKVIHGDSVAEVTSAAIHIHPEFVSRFKWYRSGRVTFAFLSQVDEAVIDLPANTRFPGAWSVAPRSASAGEKVALYGYGCRSEDMDGDGVKDKMDKCPRTPSDSRADASRERGRLGCAPQETPGDRPYSCDSGKLRHGKNRILSNNKGIITIVGVTGQEAPEEMVITAPGDSGSPLLNSSQQVIGVCAGGNPDENIDSGYAVFGNSYYNDITDSNWLSRFR